MTDNKAKSDSSKNKTQASGFGGVVVIGGLLLIVLLIFLGQKGQTTNQTIDDNNPGPENSAVQDQEDPEELATAAGLPKLLDLGSLNCVPCKMMEPILEELTEEYHGRFIVEFIDVRENQAAGRQHSISSIPTQIFFDGDGGELFRHVGFYSKEEILSKWEEMGYSF